MQGKGELDYQKSENRHPLANTVYGAILTTPDVKIIAPAHGLAWFFENG